MSVYEIIISDVTPSPDMYVTDAKLVNAKKRRDKSHAGTFLATLKPTYH